MLTGTGLLPSCTSTLLKVASTSKSYSGASTSSLPPRPSSISTRSRATCPILGRICRAAKSQIVGQGFAGGAGGPFDTGMHTLGREYRYIWCHQRREVVQFMCSQPCGTLEVAGR